MKIIPFVNAICTAFLLMNTASNVSSSSCGQQQETLLFEADLSTGSNPVLDPAITWLTSPPLSGGTSSCDVQGSVKITLPNAIGNIQNNRLKFDLYFRPPAVTGFSFHIGDSNQNNGLGGAIGTSYSAEVFSDATQWMVNTNGLSGHDLYSISGFVADFLPNAFTPHVTIIIGDEYIEFDNHRGVQRRYQSEYLFALSGSSDYDLFFSMNRAISPMPGSPAIPAGTGLCQAFISVLQCY